MVWGSLPVPLDPIKTGWRRATATLLATCRFRGTRCIPAPPAGTPVSAPRHPTSHLMELWPGPDIERAGASTRAHASPSGASWRTATRTPSLFVIKRIGSSRTVGWGAHRTPQPAERGQIPGVRPRSPRLPQDAGVRQVREHAGWLATRGDRRLAKGGTSQAEAHPRPAK